MKKKYDIFISYRRTSYDTANLIATRLKAAGYSVFFDVETLRSGKFNEQLFEVIQQCKDFLLVLPPGALDRCVNEDDWVRQEVMCAISSKKNIIPILLNGFIWPDTMPLGMEELKDYQALTASSIEYFDLSIERLRKQYLHSKSRRPFLKAIKILCITALSIAILILSLWVAFMSVSRGVCEQYASSNISALSAFGSAVGGWLLGGPVGAVVGASYYADQAKKWVSDKVDEFVNGECDDIGHYPVENISHDEALEFVHRLSKMTNLHFALPTEDEWEYAARGGQKHQDFKYAGSNDIDEVAWYRDNGDGTTHPVGEKKPNELGLYDMSGNVWEWTETPAHSYASDVESGGTIFIRRGGSWWHEAKNCRVSRRYASDHSKKTSGLGLRVVVRENVE